MGVVAILVMWPTPNEQTFVLPSHWGATWNLADWPSGFGEDLWKWQTDNRRTDDGPWLYYKLTNEPKGTGELTSNWRVPNHSIKDLLLFSDHFKITFINCMLVVQKQIHNRNKAGNGSSKQCTIKFICLSIAKQQRMVSYLSSALSIHCVLSSEHLCRPVLAHKRPTLHHDIWKFFYIGVLCILMSLMRSSATNSHCVTPSRSIQHCLQSIESASFYYLPSHVVVQQTSSSCLWGHQPLTAIVWHLLGAENIVSFPLRLQVSITYLRMLLCSKLHPHVSEVISH